MALKTALGGLWTAGSSWVGGVPPANGDTINIPAGVTIEFDADMSAFAAGIGASTINGTFKITNTPGAYYLKQSGSWTWNAGSRFEMNDGAGGLLPVNVTWTHEINGAFSNTFVTSTPAPVADLRCQEPIHKAIRLSSSALAGATVLDVDTDITGEPLYWKTGNIVFVCNVNGANQAEQRTIASVTATTITLSAGLTNAKNADSLIVMATRNGMINGGTTPINQAQSSVIAIGRLGGTNGWSNAANCVIGGFIGGITGAPFGGSGHTVDAAIASAGSASGGINGTKFTSESILAGMATVLNNANSCVVDGLVAGNGIVLNGGSCDLSGEAYGNTTVVGPGRHTLRGANLHDNVQDVSTGTFAADNTTFGSATENSGYNSAVHLPWDWSVSYDHDGVAGALKAWMMGGIVTDVLTPIANADEKCFQHACASAVNPVFWQEFVYLPKGASVNIVTHVRKDALMSYLPRIQIFERDREPINGDTPNAEIIMPGNSVDTWERMELTFTNTSGASRVYRIRTVAMNVSGNVYFQPIIRPASFSVEHAMTGGMAA